MKMVVIGVGTAAMTVADIIMESHNFRLVGFIGTAAEKEKLHRSKVYQDIPFLGDHSILSKLRKGDITGFVVAVGDNQIREQRYYEALQAGLTPINAVSSNALVNPDVTLGKGVIISPGVVLSHGVAIGNNVILGSSVIVHVNSTIGDHCYLHPGVIVSGRCDIEKNVTLRAGVILEADVSVGKNNNIAAGTVVRDDIEGQYRKEF